MKNYSLGHDLTQKDAKLPDKKWMIQVLSTLNPSHAIFKKGYRPPLSNQKEETTVFVDNKDGLFTGLPMLYRKKDLKSAATAVVPADERMAM